ncbi:MAG: DUF1080 domain-containing protein [Verrucomicrobiae bacterium]|nr:DUF1080 domain-containing protein [Verrucomicrobiae bacterium]
MAITVLSAHAQDTTQTKMEPLVGANFDGWKQLGGKAKYEIADGVVIGTSVSKTPNSFLTTEKRYGDFVLEYEFKVDEELNSGVQIRSNSVPDYRNGQVHGYQVEIDPDTKRNRMWTAGIYDEGRRGWLNDLVKNDAAREAFNPGDWNKIRVEAIGDHIRTWLNDVPAADLVDSMTQTGFIGLQVHGIGNDESKLGKQVRWRNIHIADLGRHEWKPIFDGKTLDGWKPMPGGKWEVVDGAIHGTSSKDEPRHGILLSDAVYDDFTIRFQFKVVSGDSGFYFRAEPVDGGVSLHGFQAEVDTTTETGGLYETGGRAWVSKPTYGEKDNQKIYRPGEWNEMTVSAHGTRVVVHVNGNKTAELMDDQKGRLKGNLGLQLHGGQDMDVFFKQIERLMPVAR